MMFDTHDRVSCLKDAHNERPGVSGSHDRRRVLCARVCDLADNRGISF